MGQILLRNCVAGGRAANFFGLFFLKFYKSDIVDVNIGYFSYINVSKIAKPVQCFSTFYTKLVCRELKKVENHWAKLCVQNLTEGLHAARGSHFGYPWYLGLSLVEEILD